IVLKNVPPTLITPKGISWLASQIGQPINKFVWDGLDVKVCVLKNVLEAPISHISVMDSDDEQKDIEVLYPTPQSYKKSTPVWSVKEVLTQPSNVVSVASTSVNTPNPSLRGEGVPETNYSKQVGRGGPGNGLQTEVTLGRQGQSILSPTSVKVGDDGALVSDSESVDEEIEVECPDGTTLPEGSSKLVSPREVITRPNEAVTSLHHEVETTTVCEGEGGKASLPKPSFADFLISSKLVSPKGVIT
ncbi:hypothetical protein LINPERPRIM_LOCUS870, partial [Linum perenne]